MNAAELRARIVERLESDNDAFDYPEYWRINNGVVQVGYETIPYCDFMPRRHYYVSFWQDVPFLSTFLLSRLASYRRSFEDLLF